MRADKWLWTVRLFKTRASATTACRDGAVKIGGNAIKSGRVLRIGEVLELRQGVLKRTVKVLNFSSQRLGAKEVPHHLDDLTPAEEYLRVAEIERHNRSQRPKGLGRPTKKERREMQQLLGDSETN